MPNQEVPWDLGSTIEIVEDGCGNSLPIPSSGSLTVRESEGFVALQMKFAEQGTFKLDQELQLARFFLRSRYGLADDVDPLVDKNGNSVPITMVQAIADFVVQQLNAPKQMRTGQRASPSPGKNAIGNSNNTIPDAPTSQEPTLATVPPTSSATQSRRTKKGNSNASSEKIGA